MYTPRRWLARWNSKITVIYNMATNTSSQPSARFALFRNWISMSGGVLAVAALFAFFLLAVFDLTAKSDSPYLPILTYLITPGFLVAGLFLVIVGWWLQRRRLKRGQASFGALVIDFSNPLHRKRLLTFTVASVFFLFLTVIGSYESYVATKSVVFCGEACHTSMEPQYVAYQHSPHARVECVTCHIAPGAEGFVKAKFNGLHQLYATAVGNYPRPVTGHGRLNIEQKTCEQCHWPKNYIGDVDRTFAHYLDEKDNPPYTVRMTLKVGGGDPTHGPVGGIHWHMNLDNKVEYIAFDSKTQKDDLSRQKIPWIRITDAQGKETVYKTKKFTNDIAGLKLHRMDCLDCHNRPAHQLRAPNDAVELAMSLGQISTNLTSIKKFAVKALTASYTNRTEGLDRIAATLKTRYSNNPPELAGSIAAVQTIYRQNFFPEMKASWKVYPNNIGHKDWPGCFRCHDNEHVAADGKSKVRGSACNDCHLILAEGKGAELLKLDGSGAKFKHPAEGWEDMLCSDCHNGSME